MKRICTHPRFALLVIIGGMILITSTIKAQYPVILDQTSGYDAESTRSHTVNLPPGLVSGDILLLFISEVYEGTSSWSNQPSGWITLNYGFGCNEPTPEGGGWPNWHQCGHAYYKLASGTEGPTFTYSTQVNVIISYIVYRIQKGSCSGVYGIPMSDEIGKGLLNKGYSDSPDPLPLDAPNNTNNYNLWLATCFSEGIDGTTISAPAGFTGLVTSYPISGGPSTAVARLNHNGLSLDPSPFSLSTPQYWVSGLICLQGHQDNHCRNPYRYSIFIEGDYTICEGSRGPRLYMENSEVGVSYQLFRDETAITGLIAGTGESIDFDYQSIAGVYSVNATRTSCGSKVKWYAGTVYIYPYPVDRIVSAEASSVCSGTGTNITVAESETGTVYTLKNNFGNPVWNSWGTGNGSTLILPTGALTQTTTFSVSASRNNGECVLILTNKPTVTVNTLAPITGTLNVCAGLTTQLTGSGTPAENNPWISVNPDVAIVDNVGLVTGLAAGTGDIIYKDNNGCSQTVTITVNALPEAPTAGNISATYDGFAHTATAEAPNGSTIVWYDAASEGNITVAPSGISVGTYIAWAESINSTTGCTSNSRTEVTVTISKAQLTVKANDATKYCGQINPAFSVTYIGFVNGENEMVLNGTLTISSDANDDSGIGTYSITPSGLTSENYEIEFEQSFLTINGVTIDASESSNPVPVGTSDLRLSARVLDATSTPVPGVKVQFSVENGNNEILSFPPVLTDENGDAIVIVEGIASTVDVLKVTAIAGTGCGDASTSIAYLAVYDPDGGFVTGGGWINSPAGAYVADPSLTGKANFGFVSKYKKGSNVPDGNTEFQFNAGNLNFSSSSYDLGSLVIAGGKAIYRGTGTINGTGSYTFMVSAIDGNINGGDRIDKFRIKICNADGVVYDNQLGMDENDVPTTVLGGGSIVIHTGKVTNKSSKITDFSINAYPNPFTNKVYFDLQVATNSKVRLEIFDLLGTKLTTLIDNEVAAYDNYIIEYTPENVSSGVLIYRLIVDEKTVFMGKVIKN